MQKSLIVLLAVCLLSVHAFVRRDAPATATGEQGSNYLENIQKEWGELASKVESNLREAFDPDEFKKGLDEAISKINKAVDELKPKTETPKQ